MSSNPSDSNEKHRQRVYAKFAENRLRGETDLEFLELGLMLTIPRRDVKPIARELMRVFGSLARVLDGSEKELLAVEGVGPATVRGIKYWVEIGRRYQMSRGANIGTCACANDFYEVLLGHFYGAQNELAAVLCMDGKLKVMGVRVFTEGIPNMVEILHRRVIEAVAETKATRIVLAHNHPSEILLPSPSDLQTTKELSTVLRKIGVVLMDHLIIGHDDYVSLYETNPLNF